MNQQRNPQDQGRKSQPHEQQQRGEAGAGQGRQPQQGDPQRSGNQGSPQDRNRSTGESSDRDRASDTRKG